jgi:hypothetical protein
MSRTKKDWKQYSKATFDMLNAVKDNWGMNNDYDDTILRAFYMTVFSSGYDKTGYISLEASTNLLEESGHLNTDDHYLSPQFIGRMIMDLSDKYLKDYVLFEKLFGMCRKTITVTKKENTSLRQLTDNKRGEFTTSPTSMKYSLCNIRLVDKVDGRRVNIFEAYQDVDCYNFEDVIEMPEDLASYETSFTL